MYADNSFYTKKDFNSPLLCQTTGSICRIQKTIEHLESTVAYARSKDLAILMLLDQLNKTKNRSMYSKNVYHLVNFDNENHDDFFKNIVDVLGIEFGIVKYVQTTNGCLFIFMIVIIMHIFITSCAKFKHFLCTVS